MFGCRAGLGLPLQDNRNASRHSASSRRPLKALRARRDSAHRGSNVWAPILEWLKNDKVKTRLSPAAPSMKPPGREIPEGQIELARKQGCQSWGKGSSPSPPAPEDGSETEQAVLGGLGLLAPQLAHQTQPVAEVARRSLAQGRENVA